MARSFVIAAAVNGHDIKLQFDKSGYWTLGPTGLAAYDSTASGYVGSAADRVALGRFFMEIGAKLATPKKGKSNG